MAGDGRVRFGERHMLSTRDLEKSIYAREMV